MLYFYYKLTNTIYIASSKKYEIKNIEYDWNSWWVDIIDKKSKEKSLYNMQVLSHEEYLTMQLSDSELKIIKGWKAVP